MTPCCCPTHSDLGPCGACPVHGAMAELPAWALVPLLVVAVVVIWAALYAAAGGGM